MNSEELKREIIHAGRRAVEQLIKVAKEDIIKPDPDDELAADRLKNAAATKKLAIFDAFEILNNFSPSTVNSYSLSGSNITSHPVSIPILFS